MFREDEVTVISMVKKEQ